FALHFEHFLFSSLVSTSFHFRTNSPSTNAPRSAAVDVAHHSSRVLSGAPSGTGSPGCGLRRVRMLGPLGRSSSFTGVPFTLLSRPPSWPPSTTQDPSP